MNNVLDFILKNPWIATLLVTLLGGMVSYFATIKLVRPDILSKFTLWAWDNYEWRHMPMKSSFIKWQRLTPQFSDGEKEIRLIELAVGKIEPPDYDHSHGESNIVTTRPSLRPWSLWSWRTWSVVIFEVVAIIALLYLQFGPKAHEQKLTGPMPTVTAVIQATVVSTAPAVAPTRTPLPTVTPTPVPVSMPLIIELDKAASPEESWLRLMGPEIPMPQGWQLPAWMQSKSDAVVYQPQGIPGYVVIYAERGGLTVHRMDDNFQEVIGSKVDLRGHAVTIEANGIVWGVEQKEAIWTVSPDPRGDIILHAENVGFLVVEARHKDLPDLNWLWLVVAGNVVLAIIVIASLIRRR